MTIEELKIESLDPNNFGDMTSAAQISDSRVEEWISQCLEMGSKEILSRRPKRHHETISSGNRKVLVEFYDEGGSYSVYISVITGYRKMERCFIEIR